MTTTYPSRTVALNPNRVFTRKVKTAKQKFLHNYSGPARTDARTIVKLLEKRVEHGASLEKPVEVLVTPASVFMRENRQGALRLDLTQDAPEVTWLIELYNSEVTKCLGKNSHYTVEVKLDQYVQSLCCGEPLAEGEHLHKEFWMPVIQAFFTCQ